MPTIRDLFVGIGVKADQQKLEKFDKTLESVKKGMQTVGNLALKVGTNLLKMGGIQSGSIDKFAKQTLEMERQAKALGLTNNRYQEILGTFQLFNADASDVSDVINTLTDRSVDAAGGMKSMQDDFKLVNISVKELKGLKPEAIFDLFVKKVAALEDVSKRNTAVVRLLGDDIGNKLLPLITEGAEGFAKYAKELHEFGVITNNQGIKKVRQFAIANERLKLAQRGVADTLKLAIVPLLINSTNRTVDLVKAFNPWLKGKLDKGIKLFERGLKEADEVVKRLGSGNRQEGLKRLAGIVSGGLGAAAIIKFWPVIGAIFAKVVAVGLIPLLVIGLKIAAIVVIFVALAAAIEDVIIFLRGGPSATGRFLKAVQRFWNELRKGNSTIDGIATRIEQFSELFMLVFEAVRRTAIAVWGRVFEVAKTAFDGISTVGKALFDALSTVFGAIYENVVKPIFGLIQAIFSKFFGSAIKELKFLLENWDDIFEGLGKTADGLVTTIKSLFKTGVDFIVKQIGRITGVFDSVLGSRLKRFKGFIQDLTKQVNDAEIPVGVASTQLSALTGGNTAAVAGAAIRANTPTAQNINQALTVNNTVNASKGMDERAIGNEVGNQTKQATQDAAKQLRFRAAKER